jgi:hypothetical protein
MFEVAETFSSAVQSALAETDDQASITRIKGLAAGELKRADSRARVRFTDYFNHSYVPDMVLSWDGSPDDDRKIFLRFARPSESFANDISRVADQHTTLFSLQSLQFGSVEESQLNDASAAVGALVVDQPGFAPVTRAAESGDAFVGLYASAFLRNGQGFYDTERASQAVSNVDRAYQGSISGDREATAVGARTLHSLLQPAAAAPLTQLLEAVWAGDGEFPESIEAVGQLDDDALRWLLRLHESGDLDFWRRVGRRTDLAQLERIAPLEYLANFQYLVRSNLDHLHAKGALVLPLEERMSDHEKLEPEWSREGDALALDIDGYRIVVGSTIAKVRRRAKDQSAPLPTVETVARRKLALEVPKLRVDGRDFALDAVAKERGVSDTRTDFERIADRFEPDERVSQIEVHVPGGGRLHIDFASRVGTAIANSNPYLSEVARVSALVLCEYTDALVASLEEALPVRTSAVAGQGVLPLDIGGGEP